MTNDEFKAFCRDEFGIVQFTKAECFKKMTDVFDIKGRTFVDWAQRNKIQPYFSKSVEFYLKNKKLEQDIYRLTIEIVQISERLDNI